MKHCQQPKILRYACVYICISKADLEDIWDCADEDVTKQIVYVVQPSHPYLQFRKMTCARLTHSSVQPGELVVPLSEHVDNKIGDRSSFSAFFYPAERITWDPFKYASELHWKVRSRLRFGDTIWSLAEAFIHARGLYVSSPFPLFAKKKEGRIKAEWISKCLR